MQVSDQELINASYYFKKFSEKQKQVLTLTRSKFYDIEHHVTATYKYEM